MRRGRTLALIPSRFSVHPRARPWRTRGPASIAGCNDRSPLTTGQVDLLKADNVASGTLPGLRELNILSKAVE